MAMKHGLLNIWTIEVFEHEDQHGRSQLSNNESEYMLLPSYLDIFFGGILKIVFLYR